jgi:ABC-type Fe3+ transport system permease subunit
MMLILFVEIVGYFGLLWLQATWYKNGQLTESRFALFQIAYWSLFTITAFLAISTTSEVTIIGIIVAVLLWVLGYPMARWIYRQVFPPK